MSGVRLHIFLVSTLLALLSLASCEPQPIAFDSENSTLTLCTPYTFSWAGGTPSYTLSLRIPTEQVDLPAELPFTNISNTHFTWTPDLKAEAMVARVIDSQGASAMSGVFSVQAHANGTVGGCAKDSPQNDVTGRTTAKGKRVPTLTVVVVAVLAAVIVAGVAVCIGVRVMARSRYKREMERLEQFEIYHPTKGNIGKKRRSETAALLPPGSWSPQAQHNEEQDADVELERLRAQFEVPEIIVTSPTIAPSVLSVPPARKQTSSLGKASGIEDMDDGQDEDVPLIELKRRGEHKWFRNAGVAPPVLSITHLGRL